MPTEQRNAGHCTADSCVAFCAHCGWLGAPYLAACAALKRIWSVPSSSRAQAAEALRGPLTLCAVSL